MLRAQEEESSEAIKEWLRRLKLVLYRVDDLCDEVLTLDRQNHQRMGKNTLGKLGNLFSRSNRKLANEIKSIKKELDDIKSDMACLNLASLPVEELPMARSMDRRETSSFVYKEDFISRENEKNLIIEMLFDPRYDEKKITVIPIIGFGGLGKTTLAQLVFNDEKVQRHFDLTRWAYVPEKDNHTIIMRKIFKSFTGSNYDDHSLEQIQQGIKESIETKKYLLVLDDIWEERGYQLRDLRNLLECGNQGSKVIITTLSDVVAKVFGNIEVTPKLGKVLCNLSMLPHLRSLVLGHLDKLEYVEEDNVRDGAATHNLYFPSLEVLKLHWCSKLEGWRRPSKDDGRRHQLVIPSYA